MGRLLTLVCKYGTNQKFFQKSKLRRTKILSRKVSQKEWYQPRISLGVKIGVIEGLPCCEGKLVSKYEIGENSSVENEIEAARRRMRLLAALYLF